MKGMVIDMGITGCVMVKNEGNLLRECLEGLCKVVDEIIVVNNGSTDNTRLIAEQFGCTIIDSVDFTLDGGRNLYVEAAKNPWILVLDADERISPEYGKELQNAVNTAPLNILAFNLPRIEYIGEGKWAIITLTRLFRKHPDIKYNDVSIHASVLPSIEKLGGEVKIVNIPIHHMDILFKNRSVIKREKYINLLKEEIKNNDTYNPKLHLFLAFEYTALYQFENAENEYMIAKRDSDTYNFAKVSLAQHHLIKGDLLQADKEADILPEMNDDFKNRAYTVKAEVAYRQKRFDEALNYCTCALKLNLYTPHHHINIASLLEKENPESAIEHLEEALRMNPYLMNSDIYRKGEVPNTFLQQNSFLSSTRNIFSHMDISYRNLGEFNLAEVWKGRELIVKSTR
jgi:Glycosyltransferases involved in cell wall biogenesis